MQRKLVNALLAGAMSFTMVVSSSTTVLAEGQTLEGDQGDYFVVSEGEELTINGSIVPSEDQSGSGVAAVGGTVHVTGDVTGNGYGGVHASRNGTVTIDGNVTKIEESLENGIPPYEIDSYDGATVNVGGNVTCNVYAGENGEVNISGNLQNKGGDKGVIQEHEEYYPLLKASGEGANVKVDGNVDGSNVETRHFVESETTRSTRTNETTTWTSDVEKSGGVHSGVEVEYGASVEVGGSVLAGDCGVHSYGDSSLHVKGDVVANGTQESRHTTNDKGYDNISFRNVKGRGIYTDGDGNILIEGNVEATGIGIAIDTDPYDYYEGVKTINTTTGSLVVLGTVKATDTGIALSGQYTHTDDFGPDGSESAVNSMLAQVPEITVYAIEAANPVGTSESTEDCNATYSKVYEKVIHAINYIIKHDDSVSVSAKTKEINGKSYKVANLDNAFTATAKLADGYTLSGGDNVQVVDNGDGTFTLTLINSKGGINITAVLKPSSKDSSEGSYDVIVEDVQPSAPEQTYSEEVVVTNTSSSPEAAAAVAAISGDKPAVTVSFQSGKSTVVQYKNAVINNVASVPNGGALNIITDKPSVFDTKMIEAIAARSDIDVNVVFTYGGKKLLVVIPAGYNVKSLLDSNGYCGFLRLLAILGGKEIA